MEMNVRIANKEISKYIETVLKRIITALLAILMIFTSCSSTETEVPMTEEELRIQRETRLDALELITGDTIVMTRSHLKFPETEIRKMIPPSLLKYSEYLPLYDSLLSAYLESLRETAERASLEALSVLEKVIEIDVENPDYYMDHPITPLIREMYEDEISAAVTGYVTDNYETEMEAYDILELECKIIKANYDNLNRLGEKIELGEPEPVDTITYTSYITERIFSTLLQCETYLRNKPLSEVDNPLYSVFWE